MLEDIILFETTRSCRLKGNETADEHVFKLLFDSGEYDMVTLDPQKGGCRLYEIQHSTERVPAQARHLLDRSKLALVRRNFGRVLSRTVLYRGENADLSNGISYRNVNDYLKGL